LLKISKAFCHCIAAEELRRSALPGRVPAGIGAAEKSLPPFCRVPSLLFRGLA
jgi:hypothetical protein